MSSVDRMHVLKDCIDTCIYIVQHRSRVSMMRVLKWIIIESKKMWKFLPYFIFNANVKWFDLINCWFFNNIKQWIINYFWKCCLRIQKKWKIFNNLFDNFVFFKYLNINKKRENLLFLVNYKYTIFRKYLQLCKFIYYNIIYLKKEGKNEVCKDIDSVKFWSKNGGRERGGKEQKGKRNVISVKLFSFP